MKLGPRKTAELLAQAKTLRTEEKLIWREIAKRIGVQFGWLMHHKPKIEGIAPGPVETIPKKDLPMALDKVKTMREQGASWKAIGDALGVDWLKLYRVNRHHTNGVLKK